MGSALLIAVGRSGEGIRQALGSHYVTATYPLAVACLALIYEHTVGPTSLSRRLRRTVIAALVALPLLQAAASASLLPTLRKWTAITHRNSLAIACGTATDEQIHRSHHPSAQLVRDGTAVMRAHGLAWFHELAGAAAPAGGVDLVAGRPPRNGPLRIDVASPWTVEGWAVGSAKTGGPVCAIQLRVDGRAVGTTVRGLRREDVAASRGGPAFLESGWRIEVPAGAVSPGPHRLRVTVPDFASRPHLLLDVEVTATAPAAAAASTEGRRADRRISYPHRDAQGRSQRSARSASRRDTAATNGAAR